jgi:uncharacterized protein DUF2513
MQANMDLIRKMVVKLDALYAEKGPGTIHISYNDEDLQVPGHDFAEISEHYQCMLEQGLLREGSEVELGGGIRFTGLSSAGREFLKSIS